MVEQWNKDHPDKTIEITCTTYPYADIGSFCRIDRHLLQLQFNTLAVAFLFGERHTFDAEDVYKRQVIRLSFKRDRGFLLRQCATLLSQ